MKLSLIICVLIITCAISLSAQPFGLTHQDAVGQIRMIDGFSYHFILGDLLTNYMIPDTFGLEHGDWVHITGTTIPGCEMSFTDPFYGDQTYYCLEVESLEPYTCAPELYNCCNGYRYNIIEPSTLDISDLLFLVYYMFGEEPPEIYCEQVVFDMNRDGFLDISDLLALVSFQFIPGSEFEPPCLSTYPATLVFADPNPPDMAAFDTVTVILNADRTLEFVDPDINITGHYKGNSLMFMSDIFPDLAVYGTGVFCNDTLTLYYEYITITGTRVIKQHFTLVQ